MSHELKVLLVSPEVRDLAATGGLGDVAAALPREFERMNREAKAELEELGLNRVDIRIAMPHYGMISASVRDVPGVGDIDVPFEGGVECARIQQTALPSSEVPVYLVDRVDNGYFGPKKNRSDLFGSPDDYKRFVFFNRATLEFLWRLDDCTGWKPDVIHCNDWQTGLIPVYLSTCYRNEFSDTGTLYTIHNMMFQGVQKGVDGREILKLAGLGSELFTPDALEFYKVLSFGKGGLVFADVVNTVSKTYAREILTAEYGAGFDSVLRKRTDMHPGSFVGIRNGIDYGDFDPTHDQFIEQGLAEWRERFPHVHLYSAAMRYARQDPSHKIRTAKGKLKAQLQAILGLERKDDVLLFGSVGRIGAQKYKLLMMENNKSLNWILEHHKCQVVILGRAARDDPEGQEYRRQLGELGACHPNSVCLVNAWYEQNNEGRALPAQEDVWFEHLIYAASDIFLMPSLWEPCGLSQMYSHRYGTVPIARKTGGLADTVNDESDPVMGNGFVFERTSPDELIAAFQRAYTTYFQDPARWDQLVAQGMSSDHSWASTASLTKYLKAYQKAMNSRGER